jgi:xanthine dehydrogenase molybdopterin-binding subunit B
MVIGAILAVDQETAQRAARLVRVDYEDLPALITMEEVGGNHTIFRNKGIVRPFELGGQD